MTDHELLKAIEEIVDKKLKTAVQEIKPDLLTVEDVCEVLQITKRTFLNWQKKEHFFTFVQYGQTKRIPRKSLDDFLSKHSVKGKH